MDNKTYVDIYPGIELSEYGLEKSLIAIKPDSAYTRANPSYEGLQSYMLNESSAEILGTLSKGISYEDAIEHLALKYSDDIVAIDEKVTLFFDYLNKRTIFEVSKLPFPPGESFLKERFHNHRYPMRASIELTHKCNMECQHCYGSYGPRPDCPEVPLDEINRLFSELYQIGVIGVELTGGEVSVYPFITRAVESAFENGIEHVTLLTNGAALPDELLFAIERYKDRMTVQVDLHSLNDAYYEWFTGMKSVLGRVVPNIDRLIETGAKVIVGSIITPGNLTELENLAQWSLERGAFQFSPSLVVGIGRAKEGGCLDSLCLTDIESTNLFIEKMEEIYRKYPEGFVRRANVPDGISRKNCGTLYQHVTISPEGNVKICAMNSGDRIGFSFGNIFKEDLKSIYERNASFIDLLIDLVPPGVNPVCEPCDFSAFCYGCIERGLEKAAELNGGCDWYEQIPCELKERFAFSGEKSCHG